MKSRFRSIAVWAVLTGALMGVSFGAGFARGKGEPTSSGTGMTQQQIQQMIGGGTGGGGQQTQQPGGGAGGPVIITGPGPGG